MIKEQRQEHELLYTFMQLNKEFPELSNFITSILPEEADENKKSPQLKKLVSYLESLEQQINDYKKTEHGEKLSKLVKVEPTGYPVYPPSDDIYNKGIKEMALNPEDISKKKTKNEKEGVANEKNFSEDMSGDDLDVPGSELDDEQEKIGSEDEENNYYSIGGDNHQNLDEDKA
ncbi:MAG: hypothetical protein WC121_04050 [Candidatus Kapaibacterium sp.]